VDYLIRVSEGFPIAVLEAKAESEPAEAGLEQAKEYARDLGLTFSYSTNGHVIIEYDFFTQSSRVLANFPRPEELWQRWTLNTGLTSPRQYQVAEEKAPYSVPEERWKGNPLLYPYCPESVCGRSPFYFQELAIRVPVSAERGVAVVGSFRAVSPTGLTAPSRAPRPVGENSFHCGPDMVLSW
jgi:type I restriction enzyme R subunit